MKTLIISIIFLSCLGIQAQNARVEKIDGQDRIYFSVSSEANIRYYIVDGANDTTNFEILGRVSSLGNTVQPRTYVYDNLEQSYKNYRIRQFDFSGSCLLTQYVIAPKDKPLPEDIKLRELSIR